MSNVSIARRYARALLDASGAAADEVSKQLEAFEQVFSSSKELSDMASNPAYSRAQRQGVVTKLGELTGVAQPQLINLLKLLNERNRLAALPDIARVYRDLADTKAGRVRGKVTSAVPLQPEQLKKLEQALEKLTQRDVVLEATVDRSLIGGITAQVGGVIYDGSLKGQLLDLAQTLK